MLFALVGNAQTSYPDVELVFSTPVPLLGGTATAPPCATSTGNPFTNCSFETGDFTGWINNDSAMPFIPQAVEMGGVDPGFGFFLSAPTDGAFAAVNGFDSGGGTPDFIELAQDVSLPAASGSVVFDYRGAYDLATFGATMDREFRVEVQASGGGPALASTVLLTAVTGSTVVDTGSLVGEVDVSGFAGQAVRIAFVWEIPEIFSGPGFFQIDNVSVIENLPPPEVPALNWVGLLLTMMLLGFLGVYMLRQRSR